MNVSHVTPGWGLRVNFVCHELGERGLSALDLRALHRLLPHVGSYQQVRIRQSDADTNKLPKPVFGIGKQLNLGCDSLTLNFDRGREWRGQKREIGLPAIGPQLCNDLPCGPGEITGVQEFHLVLNLSRWFLKSGAGILNQSASRKPDRIRIYE
jgi:hypothetical protein